MLSRLARQRATAPTALLRRQTTSPRTTATLPRQPQSPPHCLQKRTLVAAPKKGDGPLMQRRADRELPSLESTTFRWSRTLPLFAACIAVASVAIFNYQKLSSPVVEATLYALRTSDRARAVLGSEIYFAQQIPWISGEMNQLRGRINISFKVKGTKGSGVMRFVSHRPTARGQFQTTEWSLELDGDGGRVMDLLEDGDPFKAISGGDTADWSAGGYDEGDEELAGKAATRGFRQEIGK
ncbi:cytochrome c oxidase assembly factor 1 [Staphylotrichum tortipilum]|uniref:Cytochrome c oxidase assembly factor 1 n=1 Tax=Staphylotrichum tortipilum TaxID=2831512 RepID=A0AAN6MQU3_9PEZI|nr:cytochrome c oxidase assembly factor 1 [Staphylotrichum longicolle]